ncbi:autotransporter outer membrane beta-barrel domain-containing protein [Nissabacter sp. SGAir0207]|uniref:autotransporter outer membrane beta-barrel domain-containing protein n=1 Tax=Nissabacter sp. SGAir0207 TaxID=2126321 RepID=UPI00143DFB00|nr:autotransporter outer membrane beta-barrel domain-containing protein [Nissabacter sp. SGAir0207]
MRLLALAVMLAISGQSAAATHSSLSTPCPRDLKGLSQEQIAKLPPECLKPVATSPAPVAAPERSGDAWNTLLATAGVVTAGALSAWALSENDNDDDTDWDPEPTPQVIYIFDNDATVDTKAQTLTLESVKIYDHYYTSLTFDYAKYGAQVRLIAPSGRTLDLNSWAVRQGDLLLYGTVSEYELEWNYDALGQFNLDSTLHFSNGANVDIQDKTLTLNSVEILGTYYSSLTFDYRNGQLSAPNGQTLYVTNWKVSNGRLLLEGTNQAGDVDWAYDDMGDFEVSTSSYSATPPTASLAQHLASNAQTTRREARVLSHRFTQLAQQAAPLGNGLAFNLVAQGDPRAELGNDTDYDMLALRQSFSLGSHQLALEYGMARLDGSGAQQPGDSGLNSGYSQFFGLTHQLPLDDGWAWQNSLRYDLHQLDSSRMASTQSAQHDQRWQSLEFRSDAGKTFTLPGELTLTPYAGVRVRHTLEGGYQEQGAYRLNMDAVSESAVDAVAGLRLEAGDLHGWRISALLEGGPNLGYHQSQRTASLAGHRFTLEEEQEGGGLNSLMQLGAHYQHGPATVGLDAWRWQEESIRDKGLSLTVKYQF